MMRLAGIDLTDDCLLELVGRLRRADLEHVADRIVGALMAMQTEVTLTPPDLVAIVTVLDDSPPGLAELRAALLQQDGRVRDGRGQESETIPAVTSGPTKRDVAELREKRLAANEVFFRELNEKLERQTDGSDTLIVVCECADEDCAQRLELTRREYEAARSEPVRFVVSHGHVDPEIEEVISRTERYELVRKLGVGREVATRLESTSDSAAPTVGGDH